MNLWVEQNELDRSALKLIGRLPDDVEHAVMCLIRQRRQKLRKFTYRNLVEIVKRWCKHAVPSAGLCFVKSD